MTVNLKLAQRNHTEISSFSPTSFFVFEMLHSTREISLLYIYSSQKEINMYNNSRWHKRNSVIYISNQHALPDQCKLCILQFDLHIGRRNAPLYETTNVSGKKKNERYTLGV